MPEGDSVLQLSERLQWMQGRTITHTDIRVPRFATHNLDGQVVHRVWPYGSTCSCRSGMQSCTRI